MSVETTSLDLVSSCHTYDIPTVCHRPRETSATSREPLRHRRPNANPPRPPRPPGARPPGPSPRPPGARPPPRSPDAAPPLPMIPPPSRFPRATVPGLGGNLVVSTRIARNTSSSVAISGPYPAASGSRSNAAAACVAAAYAATSDAAPSTTRAARCAARRRRTPAADTPASLSLGLVHASAARWDPLGTDRGDAHEASPSPSRTTAPGEAGRTRRRRRRRNARIRARFGRDRGARAIERGEKSRAVSRDLAIARGVVARTTQRGKRAARGGGDGRGERGGGDGRHRRRDGRAEKTRRGGRRERRGGGGARRVKTAAFVLRRVFLRSARAGGVGGSRGGSLGGSRGGPRGGPRGGRAGEGKYPPTCADAVGACRGNGNGNEATATGGAATADVDRSCGAATADVGADRSPLTPLDPTARSICSARMSKSVATAAAA